MTRERESAAKKQKVNNSLLTAWIFRMGMAALALGAGARLLKTISSESSQQISTGAAVVPTPGRGAMSVVRVDNPFDIDLQLRAVFSDTLGTNTLGTEVTITDTVPACSSSYIHTRDIKDLVPFTGAATLYAVNDITFTANLVDYDYPGSIPIPTDEDYTRWADINGNGEGDVGDIQAGSGRLGGNQCNGRKDYLDIVDIANANGDVDQKGKPRPQGAILGNTIQALAYPWSLTYTLTSTTNLANNPFMKSLESVPAVNVGLAIPDRITSGQTFTATFTTSANDLGSFQGRIVYPPDKMRYVRAQLNPDLIKEGQSWVFWDSEKVSGTVIIAAYSTGKPITNTAGEIKNLADLIFDPEVIGETVLSVEHPIITKRLGEMLAVNEVGGTRFFIRPITRSQSFVPYVVR